MKALVMGAGVVGVTAAWYLARSGYDVTVIERREGAGLETSFANGGQVSPCHAEPWANPGTPRKMLKWLGKPDAPLVARWTRWDPALWRWGISFLANCTAARTEINTERTLRVALYSRQCLSELREETGIQYDQSLLGILHIYRDEAEFEGARHAAETMARYGLVRQVKTPAQCLDIEPALRTVGNQLAGGIFTPQDESGDAHLFTTRLAGMAAEAGVTFSWNTSIQGFEREGDRLSAVVTDKGRFTADAYVLALASYSPLLARQLGLRLPIYPAKGYSITAPLDPDRHIAPRVSITDDENKLVFSRLGNRLRAAGTAEMAGWDASLTEIRAQTVLRKTRELFPQGAEYDRTEFWAGLRAVTPDSVPILGATPVRNLWLNTGHGTLGWTMACGAGRLLADLIAGRKPDIDPGGLGLDRF
ncbi:D-amino acid dehydrogenase [Telmatospirillum sp. J64-1]|uniref:D-amino acid dehydrogenase n=1 Tax=Telmatospirillum sp. J64-1 TaxID=2502183 RepID=UPI00115CB468|nr:D-amino acid dehydrogenase [Telmatospirillum sp. J64-1]